MSDISPAEMMPSHPSDPHSPVPAARPLGDFSIEWVGDEVVMFDGDRNRYHTLNSVAYAVWRACDGRTTPEQILQVVSDRNLDSATVEMTVAQLGESGLLLAQETVFDSTLPRRRLLKLAAAGALGTMGIPLVKSITVPDSASAASGCSSNAECVPSGRCCCCHENNANCDCSDPVSCEANPQKHCLV